MSSTHTKFALLAALAGAALVPSAAQAVGFTGSFAPGVWAVNSYQTPPPIPPNGATTGSATETQANPAYQCATPGTTTNCVYFPASVYNSSAVIVGSDASTHGLINQQWSTQWEMTYLGADPKSVSFDWAYVSQDGAGDDQSYYYVIDPGDPTNPITTLLSSTSGDTGSGTVALLTGWKLGFGVYTKDNNGLPGNLSITNFDSPPAPVPGPLPLLGGGAAFAWSRRLRRRVNAASGLRSR